MNHKKIDVFFYGSYINFEVLKEVDLVLDNWEAAKLNGYDIVIQPRANLVPSDETCVYGIVAHATHIELESLYKHAKEILGEVYLPEAVLVETENSKWQPTLCYICHDMKPKDADPEYVYRIAGPAIEFGFPDWYVKRIESFAVGRGGDV